MPHHYFRTICGGNRFIKRGHNPSVHPCSHWRIHLFTLQARRPVPRQLPAAPSQLKSFYGNNVHLDNSPVYDLHPVPTPSARAGSRVALTNLRPKVRSGCRMDDCTLEVGVGRIFVFFNKQPWKWSDPWPWYSSLTINYRFGFLSTQRGTWESNVSGLDHRWSPDWKITPDIGWIGTEVFKKGILGCQMTYSCGFFGKQNIRMDCHEIWYKSSCFPKNGLWELKRSLDRWSD